ncbi:PspC domain-containing protein [bacterium]|nr:PspC domain-containing protein [bacterium]
MSRDVDRPRRLYRSTNDRIVAGLCGGLADYMRVDVAWVRLVLVLSVLLGMGAPIFFYLIAWLVIPSNPQPSDLSPNRLHRSNRERMIAGVCGGLAETYHLDPTLVRLGMALLLIACGVAIPLYLAAWFLLPLQDQAPQQPLIER